MAEYKFNIYDDNKPEGYVWEAIKWMKVEKSRQSGVRMREADWLWLIGRMKKAFTLMQKQVLPSHITVQYLCEYCQETTNDPDMHRYCKPFEDKGAWDD